MYKRFEPTWYLIKLSLPKMETRNRLTGSPSYIYLNPHENNHLRTMTGSFFLRCYKTQQTKFEVQCSTRERLNNPISFKFLLVSFSTNYACGYSNRKKKVKKTYYHSAVNYIHNNPVDAPFTPKVRTQLPREPCEFLVL